MTAVIRVLLVEDNPGDALLQRKQLAGADIEVQTVGTLSAALSAAQSWGPSAVVLDLNLPDSDGLGTLREFRKAQPHIPIVVLTGLADASSGLEAIEAGADDFVEKWQLDGPALRRVLRHAVRRKALYEQVYDSMWRDAGPLLVLDVEGAVLAANPAARAVLEAAGAWPIVQPLPTEPSSDVRLADRVPVRLTVTATRWGAAPALLARVEDRREAAALARAQDWLGDLLVQANAVGFLASRQGRLLAVTGATGLLNLPPVGAVLDQDHPMARPLYEAAEHGSGALRVDIADRTVEASLRRTARDEISGVVLDVTASEALRKRVVQSQKMKALGQLAGGLAHDLNNLLTVIRANTSFVLETATDPGARDDLAASLEACDRGSRLLRRLLHFAKPPPPSLETLDVAGALQGISELARPLLRDELTLRVDLAADLHPVLASRTSLERIVLNLVLNARDATPAGGQVTIVAANERNAVRISVEDTGPGMPARVLARAMEPFFTTKIGNDGTGLGLSTVHALVVQLGGDVQIRSRVGRGTCVEVRLPLAATVSPQALPQPERLGRLDGASVLVCDDRSDVRKVVARVLEPRCARLFAVASGEEALALLQTEPIDLLVSDVWMPGMSGDELAPQAVALQPGLRVLLITGHAPGIDLHPWTVLEKPFSPQQLIRGAREVLGKP